MAGTVPERDDILIEYAGDKANEVYGETIWLPQETVDAIDEYIVAPALFPVSGLVGSYLIGKRALEERG